ncbi:hypothetical protein D3C86_1895670 [compost metagenome]
MAALHQVVGQARGRHKPAATLLAINLPLGFELQQRLTHRDARGAEQLAELALGRQLARRCQQAMIDLFLQDLTDGCHRLDCLFTHQRYLSGLDQH